MRSRNTRVRSKVVALLVSLTALWAFAGYVTFREGLNMLWVTVAANNVGIPLDDVTASLQEERKLSALAVSGDTSALAQLPAARQDTDGKIAVLRRLAGSNSVDWAASDDLKARLAGYYGALDGLTALRNSVDARGRGGFEVVQGYAVIADKAYAVDQSLASWDDKGLAQTTNALVNVIYARELMAREDAIISSAITDGQLSQDERVAVTQLVGNRRFLHTQAVAGMTGDLRTQFEAILDSPSYGQFESVEDTIMAADKGLGVDAQTWRAAVDPTINSLRDFEGNAAGIVINQATPVVIGTVIRLVLLGVLGLAAVVASIVISITTARQLVRQLERLRNAARDLASYRLPRVVERLQAGEQVDVAQEAPPLEFGRDEIGQVGEAFNQVQETAIRVAVEQAELRRSVRDVFLSLARRSQALLHRQLGLLDAMERRATDSEELAELFRIDHLATRMRRNAENLIVLSGATAGRAWRKQVPMVDVLRGALAEVEDYTRVTVLPVGNASLLGRAVGDVIHLLAELIENAVSFSPPQTTVRVGGSLVGYGFAIEIEDRGLGMSPEELAAANEQLRDPPEFRLSSTARLGLFVVGRLAERHGIRVRLTESPYGGTTAIVLLPSSIMADEVTEDPLDPSQLDSFRPAQLAGVGRHRLQAGEPDRRGDAAVAMLGAGVLDSAALDSAAAALNGSGHEPATLPPLSQNGYAQPSALAPAPAPAVPAPASAAAPAAPPAAAAPASTDVPALTPGGLPLRQRRPAPDEPAADAPTAMTAPTGPFGTIALGGPEPAAAPARRDPDTTRSLMASYRSGTLRGRTDAARLAEQEHASAPASDADPSPPPPAPPPTTDQPPPWPPDAPQWTQSTPYPTAPAEPEDQITPQWTQSPESPQWTQSTPEMRETEEGG